MKKNYFWALFILWGIFIQGCLGPKMPMLPAAVDLTNTPTATNTPFITPTPTATVTFTGSSTRSFTPTPGTPTSTNTPTGGTNTTTFTPTPTGSETYTQTPTSTPTGCAKTCFGTYPITSTVSSGTTVVGLSFYGVKGCGSLSCSLTEPLHYISSMIFTASITGNLATEITGVRLLANGVLVASGTFNASFMSFTLSPAPERTGPFELDYVLSPSASGVIQTNINGATSAVMLPVNGTPITIVSSSSVTPTFTPTGTVTGVTTPCPPSLVGASAGISVMNYGQVRGYVIRTQANWDSYRGFTGTSAPCDFSTQMLVVINWGTESCTPGGGLVVNYQINSACVSAGSVDITAVKGSTCTCGGSCVYNMASTQVAAVIVPLSSLPVSITGVTDVVQN